MGRQHNRQCDEPAAQGCTTVAAAGVYGCTDRCGKPGGVAIPLSYRLACFRGPICKYLGMLLAGHRMQKCVC